MCSWAPALTAGLRDVPGWHVPHSRSLTHMDIALGRMLSATGLRREPHSAQGGAIWSPLPTCGNGECTQRCRSATCTHQHPWQPAYEHGRRWLCGEREKPGRGGEGGGKGGGATHRAAAVGGALHVGAQVEVRREAVGSDDTRYHHIALVHVRACTRRHYWKVGLRHGLTSGTVRERNGEHISVSSRYVYTMRLIHEAVLPARSPAGRPCCRHSQQNPAACNVFDHSRESASTPLRHECCAGHPEGRKGERKKEGGGQRGGRGVTPPLFGSANPAGAAHGDVSTAHGLPEGRLARCECRLSFHDVLKMDRLRHGRETEINECRIAGMMRNGRGTRQSPSRSSSCVRRCCRWGTRPAARR